MSREIQLPEGWRNYFGPVVIAQFVEFGWISQWPLTLTAEGRAAIESSRFGILHNGDRRLPYPVTLTGAPEAWEGRRV